MDDETLHARVLEYAQRLGVSKRFERALASTRPAGEAAEYFRVETLVWWERRYFVAADGRREEDPWEGSEVLLGPQPPTTDPRPGRWRIDVTRPAPFTSVEWEFDLPSASEGARMCVRFGTTLAAVTVGDDGFPLSLLNLLPVRASFEGIDTAPTMAQRGGSPYRQTARLEDRADIPPPVMKRVREFVRELDLPGYTDRIHGYRTTVRGGPIRRLVYELGPGGDDTLVVRAALPSGFLYAPRMSEFVDP